MSMPHQALNTASSTPVHREVGEQARDDVTLRVVVIRRTFAAPIEQTWDALTDPARVPRWFLPFTGDLTAGGRFQFEGNAGGVVRACLPPRRAELTWEMGDNESVIELELQPTEGGTELVLRHVADVDDAFWETYGPGAVGVGWDLAELGLALHLADPGAALDSDQVMAWQTSPAGFDFIRRSTEAWVEAAIASGQPVEAARRAGTNTYAFYTGTDAAPDSDSGSDAGSDSDRTAD